jgi:hypothetical protein
MIPAFAERHLQHSPQVALRRFASSTVRQLAKHFVKPMPERLFKKFETQTSSSQLISDKGWQSGRANTVLQPTGTLLPGEISRQLRFA